MRVIVAPPRALGRPRSWHGILMVLLVAALAACGGRSPAGWLPGDGGARSERRIVPMDGASWCGSLDPSAFAGSYSGTWTGTWSCFGSTTLSGRVTLSLVETAANFSVTGTWESGTLPPVSGGISGSSTCGSMTGVLSGTLGSGVAISFTGTVTATFVPSSGLPPRFTSGTWSASATSAGCTGSGSWSATR
jgi:hypothetical protein